MTNKIEKLEIRGFKSINYMNMDLRDLNILIGANGVGKSNFISYFNLLKEMVEQRLKYWTMKQGGADRILSFGVKNTQSLSSKISFGSNAYEFVLEPTIDASFVFTKEVTWFDGDYKKGIKENLGSGHVESLLKEKRRSLKGGSWNVADHCYNAISNWKVYHFHDTSDTAGVKRPSSVHDNKYLRTDASNLASFLYWMRETNERSYRQVVKTVRLAVPFFEDFVLEPQTLDTEEQIIRLLWKQADSDYSMWPSQLSDGSIRFICLATALLQPTPPSAIIIDEPELGLHPYAISLLGALLRSAAKKMQVIVSTQSVQLVNEFELDDLIVVEQREGKTNFKQLDANDFKAWLDEYSVGDLWAKNLLGGRPSK